MTKQIIQEGQAAPDFTLPGSDGQTITLSSYRGQHVVLYLYPKDDTPGCTIESQDFRDRKSLFENENAVIIGLSKDDAKSHDKFICKYDLNFPLASDTDCKIIDQLGAWKEKNMYGKKVMGTERSTFLIDKDGIIRHIWRKVSIEGHADEVLAAVKALNR